MNFFDFGREAKKPDPDPHSFKGLMGLIWHYVELNIDKARLTASERVAIMFTAIAFYAMITLMVTIVLLFVSIGVGHWLATTIAPHLAYLFVAAFYLLILILLIVFRNKLFLNPITKFVTRLFLAPPAEGNGK